MSRIRVLQAVSGLEFSWSPGQIVEVTDERAEAWADGYRAELVEVDPDPEVEATVVADPELPEVPEVVETTDAPPAETRTGRKRPAREES